MPNVAYNYTSLYGAEPYKDNGGLGGATVTGHNLIITAWGAETKGVQPPAPFVAISDFLFPMPQNTGAIDTKRAAAGQAMNSRHSAEIWIGGGESEVPTSPNPIFLVLNPPPEMKQQLVRSVVFNGGDPLDLNNYTVLKTLQSNYVWDVKGTGAPLIENISFDFLSVIATFSTYLPLGNFTGSADPNPIPFLQTNGADGVKPVFFDRYTEAGVADMIAAVNAGNFYVGMYIQIGSPPAHLTVKWPHSAARG